MRGTCYALVTVSMKRSLVGGFEANFLRFSLFATKKIFKREVSLLLIKIVLALTREYLTD